MSTPISRSVVLLMLAAAGCGGHKQAAPGIQSPHAESPLDSMAVAIFSVSQDTVLAPLLAGWPAPETELLVGDPEVEPDVPSTQSTFYRIQLFTSKVMSEAVSVRDEAALDFDVEVRVDFETPYYKVRLGRFATPQEADATLRRARQLGYRGAWAVRVRAAGGRD